MSELPQISFASGIISKELSSRLDFNKLSSGVTEANNVFVKPHGGLHKRYGFKYVSPITSKSRLIPFDFVQHYVLVARDRLIDIYTNEGRLIGPFSGTFSNITWTTINGEILLDNQDATRALHIALNNDSTGNIFFVTQSTHASIGLNKYVRLTAQSSRRIKVEGYDGIMPNGTTGTISFSNHIGVNTPYLENELEDIKYVQSNDAIYLTHKDHAPRKLLRKGINEWEIEPINFEKRHDSPSNIRVTSTNGSDSTARYAVSALNATTGEESLLGTSLDNEPLKTVTSFNTRNGIVTVVNHGYRLNDYIAFMPNNRAYKINSTNGTNQFTVDFASHTENIVATTCRKIESRQVAKATSIVSGTQIKEIETYSAHGLESGDYVTFGDKRVKVARVINNVKFRIDVIDNSISEESFYYPLFVTTNIKNKEWEVSLTWNEVANTEYYHIYRKYRGVYGFVGFTEGLEFTDDNIKADTANGPPVVKSPFSNNNHPSLATIHEERLIFANSTSSPLSLWASRSGNYENFNTSTNIKDTDAITLRIGTGIGGEIRYFKSFDDFLMVFTSKELLALSPGPNEVAITPSAKMIKTINNLKCSKVRPLLVVDQTLMIHSTEDYGFEIHLLGYDSSNRTSTSNDLTILARHLFEGYKLKEWAYQHEPNKLVIAKRDDGKLLVMSFMPEHKIFAWSTFEVKDTNVESLTETGEKVFIIANRNGTRSLEVMQDKNEYVDSYLVLDLTDEKSISAITRANPCVVTVNSHGYSTGDEIEFSGVEGMTILNGRHFTITRIDANSFSLDGIDSTSFDAYTSNGVTQKVVNTAQASHLANKQVVGILDNSIETVNANSSGRATFGRYAKRIVMGLGYDCHVKSLPINSSPNSLSNKKIIKQVDLSFIATRGVSVGTSLDDLTEMNLQDSLASLDKTGIFEVPVSGIWSNEEYVFIKSEHGAPFYLLSMTPKFEVGR